MKKLLLFLLGCVLAAGSAQAQDVKKIVLVAGKPSHGPGAHEFNAGTMLLQNCLDQIPGVKTTLIKGGWPEDTSVFEDADALFFYMDGGAGHPIIQDNHLEIIGKLMEKGVGLMCAHYAVEVPAEKGGAEFQKWIGGYYETKWSCNPMWNPMYDKLPAHPITNGVKPFSVKDEWYFHMRFRPEMEGVIPILVDKPGDDVRDGPYVAPQGPYEHIQAGKGQDEIMMWAVERPDGGRGVGFTGGHFHTNWGDENFRKTVLNAVLWIAKMDVPKDGVECSVSAEALAANLDPKQK